MIEIIDEKTLVNIGGGLIMGDASYKLVNTCLSTAFCYIAGRGLRQVLDAYGVDTKHPVVDMLIAVFQFGVLPQINDYFKNRTTELNKANESNKVNDKKTD